jgi:hypothetical protein
MPTKPVRPPCPILDLIRADEAGAPTMLLTPWPPSWSLSQDRHLLACVHACATPVLVNRRCRRQRLAQGQSQVWTVVAPRGLCRCSGYRGIPVHLLLGNFNGLASD